MENPFIHLPSIVNLSRRKKYLLAISGGPDSVALFHTLRSTHKLILLHLNHQLREENSFKDAQFIENLAQEYQIPYEIKSQDISLKAKEEKISLELAGRKARHDFFAETARKYLCPNIILGHHADDNAETIILNLIRGGGGLKGIPEISKHYIKGRKLIFIRPFIEISKEEILQFLVRKGLSFREDSTNFEPFTPRNRIRNEVFPLMTEILGRDPKKVICRSEKLNRENEEILSDFLSGLKIPKKQLPLSSLLSFSKPLQKKILYQWLKKNHISDINHSLIESCLKICLPENPAKTNLPKNLFLRRKAGNLFIVGD